MAYSAFERWGREIPSLSVRNLSLCGARRDLRLVAFTLVDSASAYETDSIVSKPCHERITSEALCRVRAELPDAAKLGASDDERALIRDVPFELAADMNDFGAVSLLLGSRDPDLKGHELNELNELAPIHGNPSLQAEHCLRGPEHDEPAGAAQALELHDRPAVRRLTSREARGLQAPGSGLQVGFRT